MEYEKRETTYEEERKRSDHRLRQVTKEERGPSERTQERDGRQEEKPAMAGYEASEQERREHTAPKEQLQVRGGNQRISAGYNKDKKLTLVFSRDRNDGERKEQETFKKERSAVLKQDKKYLRSGLQDPKKSAIVLEDREEKRKQFLMSRVRRAMDEPGDLLLDEAFSFMSSRTEKEQIRCLEDEARAGSLDRELVEQNRKQASALYQDLIYKEQERRDFMKKLLAQVTPEQAEQKKGGLIPALLWDTAKLAEDGEEKPEAEENRPQEPETDTAGQNLSF